VKEKVTYLYPVFIVGTLTLVSGQTEVAAPDVGISLDKVAHFVVFGALATSIIRLPVFRDKPSRGFWTALLFSAGFGILDEWHQSTTPGRQVEVADAVADALGALTASSLYRWVFWYRALLEWKPVRV